jgi:hypothetical protein
MRPPTRPWHQDAVLPSGAFVENLARSELIDHYVSMAVPISALSIELVEEEEASGQEQSSAAPSKHVGQQQSF